MADDQERWELVKTLTQPINKRTNYYIRVTSTGLLSDLLYYSWAELSNEKHG